MKTQGRDKKTEYTVVYHSAKVHILLIKTGQIESKNDQIELFEVQISFSLYII